MMDPFPEYSLCIVTTGGKRLFPIQSHGTSLSAVCTAPAMRRGEFATWFNDSLGWKIRKGTLENIQRVGTESLHANEI